VRILQNPFIRSIIIPILFVLAATLFESSAALVKGICNGEYKFRVWIRQRHRNGVDTISPMMGQSIVNVRNRSDIVDLDRMVMFDIAEFASLGIKLIIGAFAIDVAALINASSSSSSNFVVPSSIAVVLFFHLFALVGILTFVMLSYLSGPDKQNRKRKISWAAIGLGVVSMMLSLAIL
jgi:hypothetical protein